MARTQKHYTSEGMILKDIDKAMKRMKWLTTRSNNLYAKADEIFKSPDSDAGLCEKAKQMQEEAKVLKAKADRIESTRLVKLKNTLASFRTELLSGVTTDTSVVLQRK